MKKTVFKSVKSIIIAAAVCAGLTCGVISAVTASDSTTPTIVATAPEFIKGTM